MRTSNYLSLFLVFCLITSCTKYKDPNAVTIGSQIWMLKNLDVDHYANGDPIPMVNGSQWDTLTTGAWCYYDNDLKDTVAQRTYGKLYNWYAVTDPRGLAPRNWHIPSKSEWRTLIYHLGGSTVAGDSLKSSDYWKSPNGGSGGGSNSSGFTALPGGARAYGTFLNRRYIGTWWTSSEGTSAKYAGTCVMTGGSTYALLPEHIKHGGFSVRCVRD